MSQFLHSQASFQLIIGTNTFSIFFTPFIWGVGLIDRTELPDGGPLGVLRRIGLMLGPFTFYSGRYG